MAENDNHIKLIQEKLAQLVKSYQFLQKENLSLVSLVASLRKKETEMRLEMELLNEKVQILKAATGKMAEVDQKEFEKRINQYIKELDHCIGMLNE